MKKNLIVGLGNIGNEYKNTRHNIGFDIIDAYCLKHQLKLKQGTFAEYAETIIEANKIILVKPSTYMNLSGNAVLYWQKKETVALENILVLVDDLALPLEKIRFRESGSAAGHNGLKHIEQCLQTNFYKRLRFGIGNDFEKGKQIEFVLGKWQANEKKILEQKISFCVSILEKFPFLSTSLLMAEINAHSFL